MANPAFQITCGKCPPCSQPTEKPWLRFEGAVRAYLCQHPRLGWPGWDGETTYGNEYRYAHMQRFWPLFRWGDAHPGWAVRSILNWRPVIRRGMICRKLRVEPDGAVSSDHYFRSTFDDRYRLPAVDGEAAWLAPYWDPTTDQPYDIAYREDLQRFVIAHFNVGDYLIDDYDAAYQCVQAFDDTAWVNGLTPSRYPPGAGVNTTPYWRRVNGHTTWVPGRSAFPWTYPGRTDFISIVNDPRRNWTDETTVHWQAVRRIGGNVLTEDLFHQAQWTVDPYTGEVAGQAPMVTGKFANLLLDAYKLVWPENPMLHYAATIAPNITWAAPVKVWNPNRLDETLTGTWAQGMVGPGPLGYATWDCTLTVLRSLSLVTPNTRADNVGRVSELLPDMSAEPSQKIWEHFSDHSHGIGIGAGTFLPSHLIYTGGPLMTIAWNGQSLILDRLAGADYLYSGVSPLYERIKAGEPGCQRTWLMRRDWQNGVYTSDITIPFSALEPGAFFAIPVTGDPSVDHITDFRYLTEADGSGAPIPFTCPPPL